MKNKIIFIVEPGLGGHRPTYLNAIVKFFKLKGWKIVLGTVPENLSGVGIRSLCDAITDDVEIITISMPSLGISGRIIQGFSYWLHARELHRKCVNKFGRVDLVFVPYLDNFFNLIPVIWSPFGSTPFGGISMRQSFHFPHVGVVAPINYAKERVREWMFYRFIRNRFLKKLYVIDRTLKRFLEKKPFSEKISCLPDPVIDFEPIPRAVARDSLGILHEKKVLLLYGAIDSRKGVIELINAYKKFDEKKSIQLVIAGRQSSEVEDFMANNIDLTVEECRPCILNRVISVEEERFLLSASDAVWLGYKQHYTMSGVLVKAVMAGLPVIGCDCGLIGYYVNKDSLGVTVNINDGESIDRSLALLVADKLPKNADNCELKENTWVNGYAVLDKGLL